MESCGVFLIPLDICGGITPSGIHIRTGRQCIIIAEVLLPPLESSEGLYIPFPVLEGHVGARSLGGSDYVRYQQLCSSSEDNSNAEVPSSAYTWYVGALPHRAFFVTSRYE